MSIRVRPATSADRRAWDAFVAARPEGDPLQCWAWGECSALAGEVPQRLIAEEADGRLRGVAQALVRPAGFGRQVAYVPHGPVWEREAPDAGNLLAALVEGLRQMGRRERAIVVKLDPRTTLTEDREALAAGLLSFGARRSRDHLQAPSTRILDLTVSREALWATWDPDARNSVRRAAKEGVTVVLDRTGDPAAVEILAALHQRTAERAAFRGRSAAFLGEAARRFAASGGWYLGQAIFEGRPISAMGFLRVGDRAFYLWAGSLRDPALNAARGPYAALAAAIDALAADGCRSLDLWGVTESGDTQADPGAAGYSRFKRKFGGASLHHPGLFDLVIDPFWYRARQARGLLLGRLRPAG